MMEIFIATSKMTMEARLAPGQAPGQKDRSVDLGSMLCSRKG